MGKEELVVDVYVDDLIITGVRTEGINSFKHEMAAHFRMSDLDILSYYLGIEERLKLTKASTAVKVDATLYRSIVGGLRYQVHMRPDIVFAMGYVSRFMEDPREDH
ncbi:uncharacterized mitochondrial protein AtMg00810-like [Miscanthus floridulus]|uniref:uncharacterized mitochondrial protein AtMg00810-like n=1 Tax=Miscanthus floridulus TaxID=154761 RepID=UPI00345AD7A1